MCVGSADAAAGRGVGSVGSVGREAFAGSADAAAGHGVGSVGSVGCEAFAGSADAAAGHGVGRNGEKEVGRRRHQSSIGIGGKETSEATSK
eukprot:366264-Chlamydomonas_euryale.AAC.1